MKAFTSGLAIVLVLVSTCVFAQAPAPPPSLNDVPFDALALLLVVVSLGYGAFRLRSKSVQ